MPFQTEVCFAVAIVYACDDAVDYIDDDFITLYTIFSVGFFVFWFDKCMQTSSQCQFNMSGNFGSPIHFHIHTHTHIHRYDTA